MAALGHFWQHQFTPALAAAAPVAAASSDDAANARYITAQIHHAQGRVSDAISWYQKVTDEFIEASESIRQLSERSVQLPAVTTLQPGAPASLTLKYRNVREASLRVYRVDLMRLHQRSQDLSHVTSVNLAGVTPQAEQTVALGAGEDLSWQSKSLTLPLKDEGAYLLICRTDNQVLSGLVIVSPLQLEVQDEQMQLRLSLRDSKTFIPDAEVAVYDSRKPQPQTGRTDPRGSYEAYAEGIPTVVIRAGERYAYYRGTHELSPPPVVPAKPGLSGIAEREIERSIVPTAKPDAKEAYLGNLRRGNEQNFSDNKANWKAKQLESSKGVQAAKVFKK
jgi:alpha-2-macroglobulin